MPKSTLRKVFSLITHWIIETLEEWSVCYCVFLSICVCTCTLWESYRRSFIHDSCVPSWTANRWGRGMEKVSNPQPPETIHTITVCDRGAVLVRVCFQEIKYTSLQPQWGLEDILISCIVFGCMKWTKSNCLQASSVRPLPVQPPLSGHPHCQDGEMHRKEMQNKGSGLW